MLCQDQEAAWSLRLDERSELSWHHGFAFRALHAGPHLTQTPLLGDAGSGEDVRRVQPVLRGPIVQQYHVEEELIDRLLYQFVPVCASCL